MAALEHVPVRWRCWWSPPLGHLDEIVEYVDPVSGRWAARTCCARCGREGGLAVGEASHGNVYAGNPLATALARQGVKRSVPPAEKVGVGPPESGLGEIVVEAPDGQHLRVRKVRARVAFGRHKDMYVAYVAAARLPPASAHLRAVLVRAAPAAPQEWIESTARQLESELPGDS